MIIIKIGKLNYLLGVPSNFTFIEHLYCILRNRRNTLTFKFYHHCIEDSNILLRQLNLIFKILIICVHLRPIIKNYSFLFLFLSYIKYSITSFYNAFISCMEAHFNRAAIPYLLHYLPHLLLQPGNPPISGVYTSRMPALALPNFLVKSLYPLILPQSTQRTQRHHKTQQGLKQS